ncbi:MAG: hypothetical protein OEV45_03460 [Desulfobacteraceae bacterium]|nr:hypothetical protein [Desulfobacteraceae bacterium]
MIISNFAQQAAQDRLKKLNAFSGGMGGKEAVKEILAINPEAKVLVSSGYSNDPGMANYKKYGFSGAMAKPYELEELMKIVDQILGAA